MPGLTPEEELAWINQQTEVATKSDIEKIESSEAVQKLLAQPDLIEFGTYKFGEVEIRYKPHMTSGLRIMLSKAQKTIALSDNPVKAQDDLVYKALAEICPDYPDPLTWELIDLRSKDGRIYKIFKDLVGKIGGSEQSLKDFR